MRAWRLTFGAVLVLAATGCNAAANPAVTPSPTATSSQRSTAPATIPADPAAAIAAAKAKLGTESARFGRAAGSPGHSRDIGEESLGFTGVVNAQTKNWEITAQNYVLRRIGTSLYLRVSGDALKYAVLSQDAVQRLNAGAWAHTSLPPAGVLPELFDDSFPWGMANPATRAEHLTRTGTRSFTGTWTVDATKLGKPAGVRQALKLSTDLDEQGRFTKIVYQVSPDLPDEQLTFTFSDYGVKADITAPPVTDVVDVDDPTFLVTIVLA